MNPTDPQSGEAPSPNDSPTGAVSTRATWAPAVELLRTMLGGREHEEGRASDRPRLLETEPRDASLRGMLWSAPLAALTVFSIYVLSQDSRFDPVFRLFGQFSAVFVVPLLVHAAQFVTNVRFWDLSDRWDELAGWQRGVLGLTIVLVVGGVILSLGLLVGLHLGTSPDGQ